MPLIFCLAFSVRPGSSLQEDPDETVGAVLLDAGRQLSGIKVFMDFIETMYRFHKNPLTPYPYMSRKAILNTAINIQLVFHQTNIDRTRIDEIVRLLNRERN